MFGLLLLSSLVFMAAFVAADRLALFSGRFARAAPAFQHRSFGGVTRACPRSGGVLLLFSIFVALLPFSLGNASCSGMVMVAAALAAFGLLREGAAHLMSRAVASGLLIGVAIALPDSCLPWLALIAIAAHRSWLAWEAQDRVAGVPTALYTPPLAGSGLLLLLLQGNWDGFFLIAVVGGLVGVHGLHRFPPQIIFGRSGLLVLASAQIVALLSLVYADLWIEAAMLWSLPAAGLTMDLIDGRGRSVTLFDLARQRGEPEHGLATAAGALACTNVILVWATLAQPLTVRLGALVLSLFLAWQFTRFLAGGLTASMPLALRLGKRGGRAR